MRIARPSLLAPASTAKLGSTSHGSFRLKPLLRQALRQAACLGALTLTFALGCSPDADTDQQQQAATTDLTYYWQPFTTTSVWNTRLPAGRAEVALPSAVQKAGAFAPSDAAYGLNVYFAKSSDPTWSLQYRWFASFTGAQSQNPVTLRAPVGMTAPGGSDGSIVVVDENLQYAWELWQYQPKGGTSANATSVNVVDLRSAGIKGNVGITGSGLPGIGGLLKAWETKNNVAIRHKLWLAASPTILYPEFVSPATQQDLYQGKGAQAFLRYGDVVALSQSFNIDSGPCNLSPFMKRIAQALKDYGGIVQDQGGDGLSIVSEVNAVRSYIDVDYNTTMWSQFDCLKQGLVKVTNPWTGATPGGLGYGATSDSSAPTVPTGVSASVPGSTQINLAWAAASDNVGVAGYRVLRNGAQVGTATGLSFSDKGLAPSTSYSYNVVAFDAAGNQSAASTTATAKTAAGTTTTATELLSNGGFTSALAPWWTQKWAGSPQIGLVTSGGRSGGALRIVNSSTSSSGIAAQNFTVAGGQKITAKSYISFSGVTAGRAQIIIDFFDSSWRLVGEAYSAGQSAGASGWNLETVTATAPATATSAGVYLYSYAAGTTLFDDASVTR